MGTPDERPLTKGQRLYRFLFSVLGPAQGWLVPYATPEERARYEAKRVEPPRGPSRPPDGFRVVVYTDPQGIEHRSLVRDDPLTPGQPGAQG